MDAKALYPLVDPKKDKNNPGLDDNALKNAISQFLVARLNVRRVYCCQKISFGALTSLMRPNKVPSDPQPLPDFWEGSTSSSSDAGADPPSQEAEAQVTAAAEPSAAESSATGDASATPPPYLEAQVLLTKSGTDIWESLEIPPPEGLEMESAWVAALLERQAAAVAAAAAEAATVVPASGESSETLPSEESTSRHP